jgi:hypothetical protein
MVSRPKCFVKVGFYISLLCVVMKMCFLLCAFSSIFVYFHLIPVIVLQNTFSIPVIVLQNTFSWNTSGTRLVIYAYVSKFAYFSYFWTIVSSYKCLIVTINRQKFHHLVNLISLFYLISKLFHLFLFHLQKRGAADVVRFDGGRWSVIFIFFSKEIKGAGEWVKDPSFVLVIEWQPRWTNKRWYGDTQVISAQVP